MNKTAIDWCDVTWNPVTGCKRDCPYCYARGIARRFCGGTPDGGEHFLDEPMIKRGKAMQDARVDPYPYGFDPTFHRYRLGEPAEMRKGKDIFVCSMADLFGPWVPLRWIMEVMDACLAAPQHNYLFLTKFPEQYKSLDHSNQPEGAAQGR